MTRFVVTMTLTEGTIMREWRIVNRGARGAKQLTKAPVLSAAVLRATVTARCSLINDVRLRV